MISYYFTTTFGVISHYDSNCIILFPLWVFCFLFIFSYFLFSRPLSPYPYPTIEEKPRIIEAKSSEPRIEPIAEKPKVIQEQEPEREPIVAQPQPGECGFESDSHK